MMILKRKNEVIEEIKKMKDEMKKHIEEKVNLEMTKREKTLEDMIIDKRAGKYISYEKKIEELKSENKAQKELIDQQYKELQEIKEELEAIKMKSIHKKTPTKKLKTKKGEV